MKKRKGAKINIFLKKLIILGTLLFVAVFTLQLANPSEILAYRRVCDSFSCWTVNCDKNSDCGTNGYTGSQYCQGNDIYQNYTAYTCNSAGSAYSSCTNTTTSQLQQACNSNQPCSYGKCADPKSGSIYCAYHANKKCVGNSIYWFDSCGKQQDLYQSCANSQTCSQGVCANSTSYNSSIKGCINNVVYWYDANGNEQGIYQNCSSTNSTCKDGQCVGSGATYSSPAYNPPPAYNLPPVYKAPQPPSIPSKTFIKHYKTDCFNNNIYWLDSNSSVQDIYKSCLDDNQCTADTCEAGECKNTLKCDGSSCINNSPDYSKYCQKEQPAKEKNDQNSLIPLPESSPTVSFFKKWYVWAVILAVLAILFVVIFRGFSSKV